MKRLSAFSVALVALVLLARVLLAAPPDPKPRAVQMGSANYRLDWSAVGEISGGASASAHYSLNATIGQMAATTGGTSATAGECSGFECVLDLARLYLPAVLH